MTDEMNFSKQIKVLAEDIWRNDDSNTKFKMGQKVLNKKDNKIYTIIGVNRTGNPLPEDTEYALDNDYPFLIWEDELEEIK